MRKRSRFVITSISLSLGLLAIQVVDDKLKFPVISLLVIATAGFFYWSLREGLSRNMTLVNLILPCLFTLGTGLFWFLLPVNLYTRVPVIFLYAIGIYILCLTTNIYSVSTIKNIALLRAARGVGFVLTLLTAFLVFDAIFSLKQKPYFTIPLYFVSAFLLFLQGFWSIELEKKLTRNLFSITLVSSLVLAELAAVIYFWPVTVVVGSLFLTSGVYLLLGLGQAKLEERLFPTTIREYITVGVVVLISMFFATHWG
jgi:hypothetical protein